ncbi:MAG: response regulator [Bacteroidetes bacterium]|nr:response regulator [Bacteroidota bacterium]
MQPDSLTLTRSLQQYTGKPVVLCVEDDENLLSSLEMQIRQYLPHMDIELAENGEVALRLLDDLSRQGRELQLVISDQMMTPTMPGDKLLIEVHQRFPYAKKILLTGQATMENLANVINKAELFRYLTKPWNEDDLRLTLESALKLYNLNQQLTRHTHDLKLLNQLTSKLNSVRDQPALLGGIAAAALQLSDADTAILFLHKGGTKVPTAMATKMAGEVSVSVDVPAQVSHATQSLAAIGPGSQDVLLQGAAVKQSSDAAYFAQKGIRAAYLLPLLHQNELKGVIYLESLHQDQVVSDTQREVMNILGDALAIAIHNHELINGLEDKVKARTQQMEEMVRIASHDIRSPLTGVREMAGLLADPEMVGNAASFGGIIQKSVSAVLKLVDDILDLSRLEQGPEVLDKKSLDLKPYLENLASGFAPLTVSKQLKLQVEVTDGLKLVADGNRLSQALSNLLANAIKFTPEGGVVSLVADSVAQGIRIRVADTGIGIPPQDIPKVFERFGATQRKGTKGEKGTGLGMSIACQVVLLHGGTIEVSSEVNVGTTFTVLLPAA